MRVTTVYDPHGKMADAAEWAGRMESLGFDELRFPELAHNPFTAITLAAQRTQSARIGPGVAIAFARSPYVMAHVGWNLQEYSAGRLLLGIGTQIQAHNERRFSVPWGPPTERLREYIEMMRAVWHTWRTGERPNYQGEHYTYSLDSFLFNPGPIDYPDPPIAVAAARPRNTRLAAEVADGVLWNRMVSWTYRDEVLVPAFEAGARAAGRDPKDLIISGGGYVVTARDEERLAVALAEARRMMAFYGSTWEYQQTIRRAGLGDVGAQLHRLSFGQQWDEMVKLVGDEFIDRFAVVATWDELPRKVAERYGGVNTEVDFRTTIETAEEEEHAREVIQRLQVIPARGETERSPIPAEPAGPQ